MLFNDASKSEVYWWIKPVMNTDDVLQDFMYHLQELFVFLCSAHLNRVKMMLHIFSVSRNR
jgi:hypothetical protein